MASPCSSSAFLSATQSSPSTSASPPPPETPLAACVGTSSIHSPLSGFSPSPLVKSCDVYLGFARGPPLLPRFVNWLRAELEEQGVRCFTSDRCTRSDAYAHGAAKAAMDAAVVGVVVITDASFSNPYSIEEMRWFLERKKLFPVFFGLLQRDCAARDITERKGEVWERSGGRLWTLYGGIEEEWKAAVNGVLRSSLKLEVNAGNFRDKILDAIFLLGTALGRKSMVEKVKRWREMALKELPFPRNANFVGRKSELANLETILFGDIDRNNRRGNEKKSKGKEPVLWKESDEETEIQGHNSVWPMGQSRNRRAPSLSFRKGVACVCGDTGIGKTELLLEFAYKFFQRYKMILWVGGETKYLRQNYLRLLTLLGVDITMEFDYCSKTNEPKTFEEMETNAIGMVRREMMRGIPFLLIIDNLESEKDWWGGRNIMQLLPRFGGETHILISTCLPQILNIRPLKLSYLSAAEAMLLMKGKETDLMVEDDVALRIIEEKLGRIPLGLAIVGAILSELQMDPRKLLDIMNHMPYRELKLNEKENVVLKHNRGLVQLLDVCFSMLDNIQKPSKLATKMAELSYWLAPTPIPISMLFNSASVMPTKHHNTKFWNRCLRLIHCKCEESDVSGSGAEASSYLIRYSIARSSTLPGYLSFHNIIRIYGHERNKDVSVSMIVKAIQNEGDVQNHANHMWAACFLVFKIGVDPGGVNLLPPDVLSFIRSLVLPLASCSFANYSHCSASLELLRVATEVLEGLEDSFLSEATADQSKTTCFKSSNSQSLFESYPLLYRDLASLRALLLETRAKFMLRGGQYDIGEQLCRTAVNIKEVIFGHEHPQTQATRAIRESLLWFQSEI